MIIHPDVVDLARRVVILDHDRAMIDDVELTPDTPLPVDGGTPVDPPPPAAPAASAPPGAVSPSVSWLAMQLYGRCYIRPVPRSRLAADLGAVHAFRLGLSAANRGRGTWEPGWHFESATATRRIVSWNGVGFSVSPQRVRPTGPSLAPGSPCTVWVPHERRNLYPGYYFLVGDEPWPVVDGTYADVLRVYWNVTNRGAAPLVGALSRELNRSGVPFWAKVRDDPDGHGRADSAVLYLPGEGFREAAPALAEARAEVAPHLGANTPMFTRQLAPGIGVAEDPRNGLSFGQHRCELVARGLWRAHRHRREHGEAKHRAIVAEFEAEGLDAARPYLSAGSDALYRLASPGPTRSNGGGRADMPSISVRREAASDVDEPVGVRYLRAATRLGEMLCLQAYWNRPEGRCNWLGRTLDVEAVGTRTPRPLAASLGPDLYNGQAGVALFLAELFAHTGDERFRETALGAVAGAHQALLRRNAAGGPGVGFFTGAVGIAYAAWRVASLTGSGPTEAAMRHLLTDALAEGGSGDDNDIIDGRAGAVTGLLALSDAAGWAGCLDAAVRLGRALVRSLEGTSMVTGMAHGAAGYGAALLALYARTELPEFLRAGRRVLAYENGLFDPAEGNWPDLRVAPERLEPSTERRYVVTWCNGAAGVALSRLRAMMADPAEAAAYADQARIALAATRTALAARVGPDDDASLCHGSGGLIETLLQGSVVLDDPALGEVARGSIASWLRSESPHLDAELVRSDPTLMLGAAGRGHQLLRMYSTGTVRSVLAAP